MRTSALQMTMIGSLMALASALAGAATPEATGINKPALTAASDSAPAGDPAPAEWTEKKHSFFYQGFTSHYTCDSLRDQVEDVLRQLGARKSDLKVSETGCAASPDRPSPFPGANIRMSVLTPAKDASGQGGVQAHWRTVTVKVGSGLRNDAGTCELVEAINKQIVPLFTTRNVESRTNCVPHQLSPSQQPVLKLDVLKPDEDEKKG